MELQCCVNDCCRAKWLHFSQDIEDSSLCNTVGPCCSSVLYIPVCICWPHTPMPSLFHSPSHLGNHQSLILSLWNIIFNIQLETSAAVKWVHLLFSSVQFSHSVVSDSLQAHEPQHARPLCSSPIPGVYPNSCPLSQWCHLTISPSVLPFSSCPHLSQHQDLFKWVSSSHQVAKILEFQLQHQSFQWTPRTDLL